MYAVWPPCASQHQGRAGVGSICGCGQHACNGGGGGCGSCSSCTCCSWAWTAGPLRNRRPSSSSTPHTPSMPRSTCSESAPLLPPSLPLIRARCAWACTYRLLDPGHDWGRALTAQVGCHERPRTQACLLFPADRGTCHHHHHHCAGRWRTHRVCLRCCIGVLLVFNTGCTAHAAGMFGA